MAMSDSLLGEFDNEMAATRKTLERVPEDKFGWKPHAKSFSFQELASHLANIPAWVDSMLGQDSYTVPEDFKTPQASSTAELVKFFDENVAAARKALASTTDQAFNAPWTLKSRDQEYFTLPRIAVYRSFIISHSIHHRAQLGVYLRLNDIAVPAVYGPSADEQSM